MKTRIPVAAALAVLMTATAGWAQTPLTVGSISTTGFSLRTASTSKIPTRVVMTRPARLKIRQDTTKTDRRVTGRKILGAVIGSLAGGYLGGYAGAALEGKRCRCDDPGLKGRMIGIPVGTVFGAIIGSQVE
jgi:outer membrane lipoprotein SlyB